MFGLKDWVFGLKDWAFGLSLGIWKEKAFCAKIEGWVFGV